MTQLIGKLPSDAISPIVEFVLLFMPGFVSTRVYDLMMPGPQRDYGKTIYEILGYSMLTYAVTSPLVIWIALTRASRPIWELAVVAIIVLLIVPGVLPIIYLKILRARWLSARVVNPTPSSWDWAFGRSVNPQAMVLLHLTDGRLIGGVWAGNAYVSTYPIPPDIYLAQLWVVDQDTGKFLYIVQDTRGVLIWGKDVQMVEFFEYAEVVRKANDRSQGQTSLIATDARRNRKKAKRLSSGRSSEGDPT